MTTRKLPKVIAIDWADSSGYPGWTSERDIAELRPDIISSVGFLHSESASSVTISAHCAHSINASPAHAPMVIPKFAIIRRRTLIK